LGLARWGPGGDPSGSSGSFGSVGSVGPVVAGAGLLLLGVALALPAGVRVLVGAGRAGASHTGWRRALPCAVPARLARAHAARDPRRIAAPATAVAVGLAVMTAVAVVGASARASVGRAVDRGIRADLILRAADFDGVSPAVAPVVARTAGVADVLALQFRSVRVAGAGARDAPSEVLASADPAGLAATVDLGIRSGSLRALEPAGILVHEDAARARGLAVGDPVVVPMARGSFRLTVAGTYRRADVTGGLPVTWIVPRSVYTAGFGTDEPDTLVYVRTADAPQAVAARLRDRLRADFPTVAVRTRAAYRADQLRAIDRFVAVTVALLLLTLVIATLGIVNALVLAVLARTREIGLLRAVGMTPAQVRAMVRAEARWTSGVGAAVGLGVGLVWGAALVAVLAPRGLTTLGVPWVVLGAGVLGAGLAGMLAAAFPARRAARLDVLDAIGRP
ncbi:MAG: ABC transporter permease, partial [Actinomycetota bacterium]